MIISRKRFQEEIAKAVQEADERRWQYQRVDLVERDAHSRMDRIEERLRTVERIINQPIIANDAVTVAPTQFPCDAVGTVNFKYHD